MESTGFIDQTKFYFSLIMNYIIDALPPQY